MAQNSSNKPKFSEDGEKFSNILVPRKDEQGRMITESCLKHIDSLLNRASETDIRVSKWDFLGKAFSVSNAVLIFAAGLFATDFFDDGFNLPTWLDVLLVSIIIATAVLSIVFYKMDEKKGNDWQDHHKSYVDEALKLLNDIRGKHDDPEESN